MNSGARAHSIGLLVLLFGVVALLLAMTQANALAQLGPFGGIRPPAATGFTGWLLAKQALFYRALSGLIRAAKTDGSAYWGLIGISFIYGIFHAAGPGHGKAVISSYLVANQETWRRGIALSFASALLQALTAVTVVGIAAVVIGATAKAMGDTVRIIEVVSYSFIVLVGARLLWVKGRGFVHALRALGSGPEPAAAAAADGAHNVHVHSADDPCHHTDHSRHDHADHRHDHGHGRHHDGDEEEDVLPWGHAHAPEPQELAGPGGWRRGLAAVVAVGLRPCSGAIIVLVFAMAQGLLWAGIASTFVMGIGTAITVAAIATLAVAAKTLATRFAAARVGYGSLLLRGVEAGAALAVMAFGVLMLSGIMASERMGMF
ncbi:MAG TPA: nickel/cobalt transporter [Xanthobacteraceae bacterium]|nr:nickel/cobalt transporter [Xanthobacteraceae bacterium]